MSFSGKAKTFFFCLRECGSNTNQAVVIKRFAPELATRAFFYVSILYCSAFSVHVIGW